MVGDIMVMTNHYNGSPTTWPSTMLGLVTIKGAGFPDAVHANADTYPIDVGMMITGYSTAGGVDGAGYKTALQIGGNGSVWGESKSIIGTAVSVRDFNVAGVKIANPIGAAPAIDATGTIILRSLAGTGNAPLCVDARGQLFRGSLSTGCS
jgi:hypothetical protein